MGGLKLRLTSHFNRALLSKLEWNRLSNGTCVGKSLLTEKYVKNAYWLTILAKQTGSRSWKGLLKQIDFLVSSLCMQINNGINTKVWRGPWISTLSPLIPIPSSWLIIQDPELRVFELVLEEPRRWNTLILQTLFSQETANEIEKISPAQFQFHNIRDSLK